MDAASQYDERTLLNQLAGGDENAFASIYNEYHASITEFVQKYVKSPELAEDLSQEVFIRIWEGRSKLLAVQSFRAYLFIAARNHTLNALKSASRKDVVVGEIVRNYQAQRSTTEEDVLNREYLQFLHKIINRLPPRAREVFRLCREQGKSYDEVAALLGISRNSVKNHMVFSMKQLKAAVEKDLDIPLSLFLLILFGH